MEPMSNSVGNVKTGGRQFPLATLKVADITEGLDNISGGFIMEKFGSGRKWPI